MKDVQKLVRVQIIVIVLFVFFKLIRPSVLASGSPEILKTILLSLPNFFEAVIGTLLLTGIGLYLNNRLFTKKRQIKQNSIYILAPIIAGVYVITQELKIHNLGGENIFDKNDILFSIIGLLIGFLIVVLIKPRTPSTSKETS